MIQNRKGHEDNALVAVLCAFVFAAIASGSLFYGVGYNCGARDVATGKAVVVHLPDGSDVVVQSKENKK